MFRVPELLLEVYLFQIHSEGNGDALHWKKVYVVDIVSLVVQKAVINNCDEPQIQRVNEEELRAFSRHGRGVLCLFVFYK